MENINKREEVNDVVKQKNLLYGYRLASVVGDGQKFLANLNVKEAEILVGTLEEMGHDIKQLIPSIANVEVVEVVAEPYDSLKEAFKAARQRRS